MTSFAESGTLVAMEDADVTEVAAVLRELLERVRSGEMTADPGLVARIEVAIVTLDGLASSPVDGSQRD